MDTVCGRDTGCSVFNTRKVCHKKSQFSSFLVSASLPYLAPTPHDQYLRVGEVAWDLLSLVFSRRPNMANSNFGCLAVSMQLIPNKDIFDVCSGKKSNASFKMVPLQIHHVFEQYCMPHIWGDVLSLLSPRVLESDDLACQPSSLLTFLLVSKTDLINPASVIYLS